MKTTTRTKLTRLANIVAVKYGKDVINFDNYITILKKESDASGINLHIVTISKYLTFIGNVISQIKADFLEPQKQEEVVELVVDKKIAKIKIMFSDGSCEYFVPESPITEPVAQPSIEVFTGLFNYNPDGSIVIRRGTYAGCDITRKSSVLSYFKSIAWYKTWCEARVSDAKHPDFVPSKDTPRDVHTLNRVISILNQRDNLFRDE